MARVLILLPVAAFALAALAAACGGDGPSIPPDRTPDSPGGASSRLEGTAWRLERIGARGALTNAPPWLRFEDGGKLGGTTGCNSLGGEWKTSGDKLMLSGIVSTLIGCEGAVAEQEASFLAVLRAVERYRVQGTTLVLLDADGVVKATFMDEESAP